MTDLGNNAKQELEYNILSDSAVAASTGAWKIPALFAKSGPSTAEELTEMILTRRSSGGRAYAWNDMARDELSTGSLVELLSSKWGKAMSAWHAYKLGLSKDVVLSAMGGIDEMASICGNSGWWESTFGILQSDVQSYFPYDFDERSQILHGMTAQNLVELNIKL